MKSSVQSHQRLRGSLEHSDWPLLMLVSLLNEDTWVPFWNHNVERPMLYTEAS